MGRKMYFMAEFRSFWLDPVTIVPGMLLLPQFADSVLLAPLLDSICRAVPPRQMRTPRGFVMSVAMTSCGKVGWVSDRSGYRYSPVDPVSGDAWPSMPAEFLQLAQNAASQAGFENFRPDTCLINRYTPGSGMGAHQDTDEQDFSAPIVSVSLGIPARFFVLGKHRQGRSIPVDLQDGDVIVFGGPARRFFHGVRKLKAAEHAVFGAVRWNMTFRKAR
jgi:alkylated DNA repair protein (DNA oxidative demethylase)